MAEVDYDKLAAVIDARVAEVLSKQLSPIKEKVVALDEALHSKLQPTSEELDTNADRMTSCDSPTGTWSESDSSPIPDCQSQVERLQWSTLSIEDVETLFGAQNQLVLEHVLLTKPHTGATFEHWKLALGYPSDNAKRLEFIRNMPTCSTKHGEKLHCLKLIDHREEKKEIVGFIEFEVKNVVDGLAGNVREIYIRSIIVSPHLRRRGYGTMLYDSMIEYLGVREFDAINLYVMDLNRNAISLYFKLGFKVTQWFSRRLEDKNTGFKVIFLCMQKLQSQGLSQPLCISLQDMPHLFKEETVGELVEILSEGALCEQRRARVTAYDASNQTFSLAYLSDTTEDQEFPACLVHNVCLNDLYSRGYLTFDRSPFMCAPRSSSDAPRLPPDIDRDVIQSVSPNGSLTCHEDSTCARERRTWPKGLLTQNARAEAKQHSRIRKRRPWPSALLLRTCGEPRRKRLRGKFPSTGAYDTVASIICCSTRCENAGPGAAQRQLTLRESGLFAHDVEQNKGLDYLLSFVD